MKIAAATKLDRHGKLVDHLKAEYGIGHGYANLIAQRALRPEGGAGGEAAADAAQRSNAEARNAASRADRPPGIIFPSPPRYP